MAVVPSNLVKYSWCHIAIVILLSNAVSIFDDPPTLIENSDSKSAIRRAKSLACKQELHHFSQQKFHLRPTKLSRTCKLDLHVRRQYRIGCISRNVDSIFQLEDDVSNSSVCLDLCMSYGQSYGGYDATSNLCFCGGDDASKDIKQSDECDITEFNFFRVNNGLFYPPKSKTLTHGYQNATNKIKIAFLLVLNGRAVAQINRMFKNIYSTEHFYYLHIDNRNEFLFKKLEHLESKYNNVIVARLRLNTIWGGTSLLKMIMNSIEQLLSFKWDYLINLSESDFPLKSLEKLESYLAASTDKSIFLKSHNIKGYDFIRKQGLDRNFYQCDDRVWLMGKRLLPTGIVYSGGSDWFALPRDFCMYLDSQANNSSDLVAPLLQLFNYSLLPAESFFHTLATNSKFCDRLLDTNLRLTNWNRKYGCKCQHKNVVDWCGCSPSIYRSSDLEKLARANRSRNFFFSRKFDPTISTSIINYVENQLINRRNQSNLDLDTKYWQNIFTKESQMKHDYIYGQILQQFGFYCLQQINYPSDQISGLELKTVDIFFKDDLFVGLTLEYGTKLSRMGLLVERQKKSANKLGTKVQISDYGDRSLKNLEIGHDFDTSERLFRDYTPLNIMSDIAVYHEWLLSPYKKFPNETDDVKFSWINPNNQVELVQNVRLKRSAKLSKLSLAHRLNVQKPLKSGEWSLLISDAVQENRTGWLQFKFLILNQNSQTDEKIDPISFKNHFLVTDICTNNMNIKHNLRRTLVPCNNCSWISHYT